LEIYSLPVGSGTEGGPCRAWRVERKRGTAGTLGSARPVGEGGRKKGRR